MATDCIEAEFPDAAGWRAWLESHAAYVDGVWLRMYKIATGIDTVTYAEARVSGELGLLK